MGLEEELAHCRTELGRKKRERDDDGIRLIQQRRHRLRNSERVWLFDWLMRLYKGPSCTTDSDCCTQNRYQWVCASTHALSVAGLGPKTV